MTDDNLDDVQPYKSTLQDHDRVVWNEAIDAAANLNNGMTTQQRNEIRKLKK